MTFEQAAILLLLAGMLVVFALDRFRMEVVAVGGLAVGFVLGLVPADGVAAGFADPTVLTVVEILLIVQVLARSSLLDGVAARIADSGLGSATCLFVLCVLTAALSAFMNNIGALALMIPVVYSLGAAGVLDPRTVLMPISFAALLGGTGSMIGTPANLIVSRQLEAATGSGFGFFDIGWAGLPAILAGLAAIVLWIPGRMRRDGKATPPTVRRQVMEVRIAPGSSLLGLQIGELPFLAHGGRRGTERLFLQRRDLVAEAGDLFLVDSDSAELKALLARGAVSAIHVSSSRSVRREAVVMPESTVVGSRIGAIGAFAAGEVRVVAVSPRATRIEGDFADIQLSIGDVLLLEGDTAAIDDAIVETDMLSLTGGHIASAEGSHPAALAVFVGGVVLTAFGLLEPHLSFGLVILVLTALGWLNLRTGLAELNWPIIIMLAAMIPLGGAVATTGLAEAMAHAIVSLVPATHAEALLIGIMLALGVLLTPFVNNATAAIVLAPVAIAVAATVGMAPEPLLIAVALGASFDFVTPFGHHNNTLVMGLGGYSFAEFARAGWPVTLAAVAAGYAAILTWW